MRKMLFASIISAIVILFGIFVVSPLYAQQIDLNVALPNAANGKNLNIADDAKGSVIVLISYANQCAFVDSYDTRLKKIIADFQAEGVKFYLLNPNVAKVPNVESFSHMQQSYKRNNLNVPYLSDENQVLTQALKFSKIPEVAVLKTENGKATIYYHGAIDNNPQSANNVSQHFLEQAIQQVLSGKKVNTPKQKAMGCNVRKF